MNTMPVSASAGCSVRVTGKPGMNPDAATVGLIAQRRLPADLSYPSHHSRPDARMATLAQAVHRPTRNRECSVACNLREGPLRTPPDPHRPPTNPLYEANLSGAVQISANSRFLTDCYLECCRTAVGLAPKTAPAASVRGAETPPDRAPPLLRADRLPR